MTDAEVYDKLWAWLTEVMGVTVIYAYQGAKEPAEPFAVINMTLSDAVYPNSIVDRFTQDGDATTQAPLRDWYWRFSINVYGKDGRAVLRKVKTAQHVATAAHRLHPLTIQETTRVADATDAMDDETWRSRAQMDIEIRGLIADGLPIDRIEDFSFSVGTD